MSVKSIEQWWEAMVSMKHHLLPPFSSLPSAHSGLPFRGVCECVYVSRSPQKPCQTPGTSTRTPSSMVSVQRSWTSWSMSCRSWIQRYEQHSAKRNQPRSLRADRFLQHINNCRGPDLVVLKSCWMLIPINLAPAVHFILLVYLQLLRLTCTCIPE